jgi:diketogulonate reductase-like aldo/keto reductase
MPVIGLGTWQATGQAVLQAVKDALEIGYRHIDTASDYNNEKEVGEALHEQIKAGIVKREDVFITTKVWPRKEKAQEDALASVKTSLEKMNLTYVDLVLVHFPWDDYIGSYKGIEDALDQKLTRSIGISNFNPTQIENLLKSAKVKPAVNQIVVNPIAKSDSEIAYCNKLNITVTGYSPLGTGHFVNNPVLVAIGKKHNKSAAQVALRWQIQRGNVIIPKSTHKQYIKEDFEIFDFELTAEDMDQIHKI